MDDPDQPVYQRSIVAYLDLLGFKKLVSDSNPARMHALLALIRDRKEELPRLGKRAYGTRISMFSDSVAISTPLAEEPEHRAMMIVRYVRSLFVSLLAAGVSSRGGIAIGDLYHDDPIIFGKGLVQAYLQETTANYPRVIVTDEILQLAMANEGQGGEYARSERSYFRRDKDGRVYLAMFTDPHPADLATAGQPFVFDDFVRAKILDLVGQLDPQQEKERQKLTWLLAELDEDTEAFGRIQWMPDGTDRGWKGLRIPKQT